MSFIQDPRDRLFNLTQPVFLLPLTSEISSPGAVLAGQILKNGEETNSYLETSQNEKVLSTLSVGEIQEYSCLNKITDRDRQEFLNILLHRVEPSEVCHLAMRMARNSLGGGLATSGGIKYPDGFYSGTNFSIAKQIFSQMSRAHSLGDEASELLRKFHRGVDQLEEGSRDIEEILGAAKESYVAKLKECGDKYARAVDNLKIGETFTRECGWSELSSRGGHAQIYEITKTGTDIFDVILFTSTGYPLIHQCPTGDGKIRLVPQVIYRDVPARSLLLKDEQGNISRCFFQSLIELMALSKHIKKKISSSHIESIFNQLPNRVHAEILDVGLITGQRAGTCVPSVLKVWMRKHSGSAEVYKQMIFHYKFHLLVSTYHVLEKTTCEESEDGAAARFLLKECAHNLARRIAKGLKQGIIDRETAKVAHATAEDLLSRIQKSEDDLANKRGGSSNSNTPFMLDFRKQRSARAGLVYRPTSTIEPQYIPRFTVPTLFSGTELSNPKEFFDRLALTLEESLSFLNSSGENIFNAAAVTINRFVDTLPIPTFHPSPQSQFKIDDFKSPLFESFTRGELEKAQQGLIDLLKAYHYESPEVLKTLSDSTVKRDGNRVTHAQETNSRSRNFATLLPIYAISHYLALKIDACQHIANPHLTNETKIEEYGLPTFLNFLEEDGEIFLDAAEFKRINNASTYLRHFKGHKTILFSDQSLKGKEVEMGEFRKGEPNTSCDYFRALLSSDAPLREDVHARAHSLFSEMTDDEIMKFKRERRLDWVNLPESSREILVMLMHNREKPLPIDLGGAFHGNAEEGEIPEHLAKQSIMERHGYGYIDRLREAIWRSSAGIQGKVADPRLSLWGVQKLNGIVSLRHLIDTVEGGFARNEPISEVLLSNPLVERVIVQTHRNSNSWNQPQAEFSVLNDNFKKAAELTGEKGKLLLKNVYRAAAEWKMAPAQILAELQNEMEALGNPSLQEVIFKLLFRSPVFFLDAFSPQIELGVGELIANDPALVDRAEEFVYRTLNLLLDHRDSMKIAPFIMEIAFFLSRFLHQQGKVEDARRLNLFDELDGKWLRMSQLTSREKADFHTSRLLFASLRSEEIEQQAVEIIESLFLRHYYGTGARTNRMDRAARKVAEQLTDKLRTLPSEDTLIQRIGDRIMESLEVLGVCEGRIKWCLYSGCWLKALHRPLSLNLITGELYYNSRAINAIESPQWEKEGLFIRIFGESPSLEYLSSDKSGKIIYFTHPTKGEFRVNSSSWEFELFKLFDGHWLKLRKDNELPNLIPEDHFLWVSSCRVGENLYNGILTDVHDLKPIAGLLRDGRIQKISPDFKPQPVYFDYLNDSGHEVLKNFEVKKNITIESNEEGKLLRVLLPRYISIDKAPLEFYVCPASGDSVWSSNCEFRLAPQFKKGLLGTIENYLYLDSIKERGEGKIIVPLQPIEREAEPFPNGFLKIDNAKRLASASLQSGAGELFCSQIFLEYDVVENQVIPISHESQLFLAYLNYSQMEYGEAIRLMNTLKAVEPISSVGMKILEWIQELPAGVDHPDARAVPLHALSLYIKEKERCTNSPVEHYFPTPSLSEIHIENISHLLQGASNIAVDCQMNKEKLLALTGKVLADYKRNPSKNALVEEKYDYLKWRYDYICDNNKPETIEAAPFCPSPKERDLTDKSLVPYVQDEPPPSKTKRRRLGILIERGRFSPEERQKSLIKATSWFRGGFSSEAFTLAEEDNLLYTDGVEYLTEKSGALFTRVCRLVVEGSETEKMNMANRLRLWRLNSDRKDRMDPYVDYMMVMLREPSIMDVNLFSSLNSKSSSEELYGFLNKISHSYQEYLKNKSDPILFTAIPSAAVSALPWSHSPLDDRSKKALDASPRPLSFTLNIQGQLTDKQAHWKMLSIFAEQEANEEIALLEEGARAELAEVKKVLRRSEIILLGRVNRRSFDPIQRQIEESLIAGKRAKRLTISDCVDCLLTNDERSYLKRNPNLTREDIPEIISKTLEILDLKSYIGQLERICSLIKGENGKSDADRMMGRDQLRQVLHARYDFSQFPPPIQAVLHVFVGQTSIIPFSNQVSLIRRMTEIKDGVFYDRVIQLMMGGGKTSVIATLLLHIFAMNEGEASCFIVPTSLMSVAKFNLGDWIRQAFGKELLELHLERNDFTIYSLSQALDKLRKGVDNYQPIIMSASTIQGLWLEKTSLLRSLPRLVAISGIEKGLTNERQVEINDLFEKWSLINQILEIPKNGILDEVDISLDDKFETNFIDGVQSPIDPAGTALMSKIFKFLASSELIVKVASTRNGVQVIEEHPLVEFVKLRTNNQSSMPIQAFKDYVVPFVARLLMEESGEGIFKDVPIQFKDPFIRYLSEQIPAAAQKNLRDESTAPLPLDTSWSRDGINKFPYTEDELKLDTDFLHYLETSYHKGEKGKKLVDLIALARYFLTKILPHTMTKNGNRHYGLERAEQAKGDSHSGMMKIIPYVGTHTPGTTEFGNPWETAAYYYQYALAEKPSHEMVLHVAELLTQTAKHYQEVQGELFDETAEYNFFLDTFGVKLDEINSSTPDLLQRACDHVFKKPDDLLNIMEFVVSRNVTYAPDYLSSNGFDLTHLIKMRQGMTGTPVGREGWLESLAKQEHFIPEEGLEQSLIDLVRERVKRENILTVNLTPRVDQETVCPASMSDFLSQLYEQYQNQGNRFKKIRALIDTVGMFRSFGAHQEVAKEWLGFILKKQQEEDGRAENEKSVDPAIEAVLFFHTDPGESQPNTLYAWKKELSGDLKLIRVGGTTREALKAKGLKPEKYITYYDETHKTGIDIQQTSDAVGVQTFGDQPMRDLLQSLMRMRRYQKENGQDVDFVIDQDVRKTLPRNGEDIDALVDHANNIQHKRHFDSMRCYFTQNINSLFKKYATAILDHLVSHMLIKSSNTNPEIEGLVQKFNLLEEFLVTALNEDPYLAHGALEELVDTKKMLIGRLNERLSRFRMNKGELLPNSEIWERLEGEAADLKRWIEVQDESLLPKESLTSASSIGLSAQRKVQREVAIQRETKREIEQELKIELEEYRSKVPTTPQAETTLSYGEFIDMISELKKEFPQGFPSNDGQMRAYGYKHPYHELFKAPIYGTVNYFTTCKGAPLSLFHPLYKPAKQILAVRLDNGQYNWMLLSEHDAGMVKDHFNQLLKEDPRLAEGVWFIDHNGIDFVKTRTPFDLRDERVARGMVEIKVLLGDIAPLSKVEYRNQFEEWLSMQPDLAIRFLELRVADDSRQWNAYCSNSAVIAIRVDALDLANPFFLCEERKRREYNLQDTFIPKSPVEVETRCLSQKGQIGHLKSGYVQHLFIDFDSSDEVDVKARRRLGLETEEAVKQHNSRQLRAIKDYQWSHLTPRQAKWVPREKIRYLARKELFKNLSQDQAKGIVPEQQEMIAHLNPAYYVDFTEKWQIESVPPAYLSLINSARGGYVKPEQLEGLTKQMFLDSQDPFEELYVNFGEETKKVFDRRILRRLDNREVFLIKTRRMLQGLSSDQLAYLFEHDFDRWRDEGIGEELTVAQMQECVTPATVAMLSAGQIAQLIDQDPGMVDLWRKWHQEAGNSGKIIFTQEQVEAFNTPELVRLIPLDRYANHLQPSHVPLLVDEEMVQACPESLQEHLTAEQNLLFISQVKRERLKADDAKLSEFIEDQKAMAVLTSADPSYHSYQGLWGRVSYGEMMGVSESTREKLWKYVTNEETINKIPVRDYVHLTKDQLLTKVNWYSFIPAALAVIGVVAALWFFTMKVHFSRS